MAGGNSDPGKKNGTTQSQISSISLHERMDEMKHICPTCGNEWNCIHPEFCEEDDDSPHQCPICFAREHDINPDTHIKYQGAFKEWEQKVK